MGIEFGRLSTTLIRQVILIMITFFNRPSKYEAFVVIVEHFGKVILEEWEMNGHFISFYEYVHKV